PLATVAGYLCTDAWFCPWVVCRDYGGGRRPIVAGLARAVAVGGGWAAVCYLVGTRASLVRPGWASLIAEVAALEACGAVLAWAVLLSQADRAAWRVRVRSWLGRPAAAGRERRSVRGRRRRPDAGVRHVRLAGPEHRVAGGGGRGRAVRTGEGGRPAPADDHDPGQPARLPPPAGAGDRLPDDRH